VCHNIVGTSALAPIVATWASIFWIPWFLVKTVVPINHRLPESELNLKPDDPERLLHWGWFVARYRRHHAAFNPGR